jgi:hypothetical protein
VKTLHYIQWDGLSKFVKVNRNTNLKTSIMKKILKFSLVVAALLIVMNVSALGKDFSLDIKKVQGNKVTFVFNEANKVELSILDLDDKLIDVENINSKGSVSRTYDLNALPEGTYFLVAESDTKIAKYKISVIGQTAVLGSNAVKEMYKPMVVNNNWLVCVSIYNLGQNPVSIKIYNAADEVVYISSLIEEQQIFKHFGIKNLANEEYTLVMSYADKVFVKKIGAK